MKYTFNGSHCSSLHEAVLLLLHPRPSFRADIHIFCFLKATWASRQQPTDFWPLKEHIHPAATSAWDQSNWPGGLRATIHGYISASHPTEPSTVLNQSINEIKVVWTRRPTYFDGMYTIVKGLVGCVMALRKSRTEYPSFSDKLRDWVALKLSPRLVQCFFLPSDTDYYMDHLLLYSCTNQPDLVNAWFNLQST